MINGTRIVAVAMSKDRESRSSPGPAPKSRQSLHRVVSAFHPFAEKPRVNWNGI
jgi:hypothetical protein